MVVVFVPSVVIGKKQTVLMSEVGVRLPEHTLVFTEVSSAEEIHAPLTAR